MTASIYINVPEGFFVRNPADTDLGKRIIKESISLMDKLGFDDYTFKKLADKIESTEASVYRYFKSKHQLLSYLVSWYWSWVDYQIEVKTTNIDDPKRKLETALEVLTESDKEDPNVPHIDEHALHRIIIAQSARVYMTRTEAEFVDQPEDGHFLLHKRLHDLIAEYNPKYPTPRFLAGTLIAAVHRQFYSANYGERKPTAKMERHRGEIHSFLTHLTFATLG